MYFSSDPLATAVAENTSEVSVHGSNRFLVVENRPNVIFTIPHVQHVPLLGPVVHGRGREHLGGDRSWRQWIPRGRKPPRVVFQHRRPSPSTMFTLSGNMFDKKMTATSRCPPFHFSIMWSRRYGIQVAAVPSFTPHADDGLAHINTACARASRARAR